MTRAYRFQVLDFLGNPIQNVLLKVVCSNAPMKDISFSTDHLGECLLDLENGLHKISLTKASQKKYMYLRTEEMCGKIVIFL